MTDIHHHLKGIRKRLAAALENTPASFSMAAFRQQVRDFLPASYGVAAGWLENRAGERQPADLIVYDLALSGGNTGVVVPLHAALLVVWASAAYTAAAFAETLERAAHVKAMRALEADRATRKNARADSSARRSPPYILIAAHGLGEWPAGDLDLAAFGTLSAFTRAHPEAHQPDEIRLFGQHARFDHALHTGGDVQPEDRGWTRTPELPRGVPCYVCKTRFTRRHPHYTRLCPRCGDLNYARRVQTADLRGQIALVTGARVKIGYAAACRLLRAGAQVIATSRFPHDTARRFSREADFGEWCNHLHVVGLNLRHPVQVERFAAYLNSRFSHLDVLINNAAQTVKRPPAYYAHLLPGELQPAALLPPPLQAVLAGGTENGTTPVFREDGIPRLIAGERDPVFPADQYDQHGQQVDQRTENSWTLRLDQVSTAELIEVHLVNAIAPALLAARLKPMLMRSPRPTRHIINVSAAEGRFAAYKDGQHPHTNMAKAALNMLTRSIADDYVQSGIYVNSIDPGWVSDQMPYADETLRAIIEDNLPLDLTDAAARLCDPIFNLGRTPLYGALIKDYRRVDW